MGLISVVLFQLTKNYDFNSDKELEYSYLDEDGDRVVVSSDEELAQILADKTYLVIDVKEIVASRQSG